MNKTAISLFSGAGGDTLGMIHAGVNVIGFIEIDELACQTHMVNFPECHQIGKDIKEVQDKILQEFQGKVDIIFAGFPCQGFSRAGKKNPKDARNFLFEEFVRVVKIIKPSIIIGENVPQIGSILLDNKRSAAQMVCKAFSDIGYSMAQPTEINATDFGIPQLRKRCFFVGYLNHTKLFDFSKLKKSNKVELSTILDSDHLDQAHTVDESLWNEIGITDAVLVKSHVLPTGKPPTNLIKCLGEGKLSFSKRSSSTHSEIVDIHKYSKTIICTYARMPRLFVPVKREDNTLFLRPFSTLELQQIQGFPKSFVFCGNDIAKIRQIGNAVPPNIVTAIVMASLQQLI